MFEELKSQLDSLSQEVALLKEQQALQTGECRWWFFGPGVLPRDGLRPAASPVAPGRHQGPRWLPKARAPCSGDTLLSLLPLGETP